MTRKKVYPKREQNGTWTVKTCVNGVQIFKRGFPTRNAALLYEYTLKNYPEEVKKKLVVKCSELNDLFIEKGLKPRYEESSARRYLSILKCYLFPFFADIQVNKIDAVTLVRFSNYVNKLAYKDKHNIFFLAKVYLRFLTLYGAQSFEYDNFFFVAKKPTLKIDEKLDTESREWDCYTLAEFMQFLSVIKDKRDRLIFLLMFFYGLRKEEIPLIKHSDFKATGFSILRAMTNQSFKGGQRQKTTKTTSSRRHYPPVKIIYEAYNAYLEDETQIKSPVFVFPSKHKGKVIGFTTIDRLNTRYAAEAGLRRLKPHWFRHSCATYLINSGMDYIQVSKWLGHSSPEVTLRVYAHLYMDRKKEIADFIDNVILTSLK